MDISRRYFIKACAAISALTASGLSIPNFLGVLSYDEPPRNHRWLFSIRELFDYDIKNDSDIVRYDIYAPNKKKRFLVGCRYDPSIKRKEFHKRVRMPALSSLKNRMIEEKIKLSDLKPLPVPIEYQTQNKFALLQ